VKVKGRKVKDIPVPAKHIFQYERKLKKNLVPAEKDVSGKAGMSPNPLRNKIGFPFLYFIGQLLSSV